MFFSSDGEERLERKSRFELLEVKAFHFNLNLNPLFLIMRPSQLILQLIFALCFLSEKFGPGLLIQPTYRGSWLQPLSPPGGYFSLNSGEVDINFIFLPEEKDKQIYLFITLLDGQLIEGKIIDVMTDFSIS